MQDISVEAAGYLKRYLGEPVRCAAEDWVDRPAKALLATLSIPENVNYAVMINGTRQSPSASLAAGDHIKLIPILGGG